MQAVVRRRMLRPRAAAQRAQALAPALQRAVVDELHDEHGVCADEVPAAACERVGQGSASAGYIL